MVVMSLGHVLRRDIIDGLSDIRHTFYAKIIVRAVDQGAVSGAIGRGVMTINMNKTTQYVRHSA
jgi:hypothetical protein